MTCDVFEALARLSTPASCPNGEGASVGTGACVIPLGSEDNAEEATWGPGLLESIDIVEGKLGPPKTECRVCDATLKADSGWGGPKADDPDGISGVALPKAEPKLKTFGVD